MKTIKLQIANNKSGPRIQIMKFLTKDLNESIEVDQDTIDELKIYPNTFTMINASNGETYIMRFIR